MDITTIKLHKRTKTSLERFRQKNESYDKTVKRLLSIAKHIKPKLIEGYKRMGKQDLKLLKEWEGASHEIN